MQPLGAAGQAMTLFDCCGFTMSGIGIELYRFRPDQLRLSRARLPKLLRVDLIAPLLARQIVRDMSATVEQNFGGAPAEGPKQPGTPNLRDYRRAVGCKEHVIPCRGFDSAYRLGVRKAPDPD